MAHLRSRGPDSVGQRKENQMGSLDGVIEGFYDAFVGAINTGLGSVDGIFGEIFR